MQVVLAKRGVVRRQMFKKRLGGERRFNGNGNQGNNRRDFGGNRNITTNNRNNN
jgi:hypothetical protein